MARPVIVLWIDKHDKYYCRECDDIIRPEAHRDCRSGPYVVELDEAYDHVMKKHNANAMTVRRVKSFPKTQPRALTDVLSGADGMPDTAEGGMSL